MTPYNYLSTVADAVAFIDEVITAVEAQVGIGERAFFDTINGCACSLGAVIVNRQIGDPAAVALWAEFADPNTSVDRRERIIDQSSYFSTFDASSDNSKVSPLAGWIPSLNDNADATEIQWPEWSGLPSEETAVERKARVLKVLRAKRDSLLEQSAPEAA